MLPEKILIRNADLAEQDEFKAGRFPFATHDSGSYAAEALTGALLLQFVQAFTELSIQWRTDSSGTWRDAYQAGDTQYQLKLGEHSSWSFEFSVPGDVPTIFDRLPKYITTTGAVGNAIELTAAGVPLRNGIIIVFVSPLENTGDVTLELNAGSAVPLRSNKNEELAASEIVENQSIMAIYVEETSDNRFQLL